MTKIVKYLFFIILLPVTFLDAATTYLSLDQVTSHKLLAILFTVLINGTLFMAFIKFKKDSVLWFLSTLTWFIAFALDIISGFYWQMTSEEYPTSGHFILLAFSALLLTGATIASSYFVFRGGIFKFNRQET